MQTVCNYNGQEKYRPTSMGWLMISLGVLAWAFALHGFLSFADKIRSGKWGDEPHWRQVEEAKEARGGELTEPIK